jgi:sugar phosphate permease
MPLRPSISKFLQSLFIVISGEAIFMLPFLIPRLYRPLILDAWNLTNTDIGVGFAAYGVTSTISYLVGGAFADNYNPKILISTSLGATALAVIYLVLYPSPASFVATYGFFGVSTVLLMWGALIKTTHVIGGEANRSAALGILDSGRGLVAALASSALLILVSFNFPQLSSRGDQLTALRWIYFSVAGFVLLLAVATWVSLHNLNMVQNNERTWNFKNALESLKDFRVWLLSVVILSSYCGYKGIDNYSIYLTNVHNISVERTSQLMSILLWLRPFSVLGIGFLSDLFYRRVRLGRFHMLTILLLTAGLSQTLLAFFGFLDFILAFSVMATSVCFVYGLRAVYFSVFGDLKIQNYLIGTTVGIVSFVGFLPDIFLGYVSGRLVDTFPGELGFRYTFLFTAACLFAGALASVRLSFTDKNLGEVTK